MLRKKTVNEIYSVLLGANKILLTFHVSPDGDSVGSVLAFDLFLRQLGKKTKIISFSKIPRNFLYLPGMADVEIANIAKINLSEFDLYISLDAADKIMITKSEFPKIPERTKVINIDHHITNPNFGDINFIENVSSTAEVVYDIFKEWKVTIDKQMAKLIFLGIFADTGCFQYPLTSAKTFSIASALMKKGADLNETVFTQFRSYNFKTLKYWGKVLENMQLDESKKFVWSVISASEIRDLEIEPEDIDGASSLFAPVTLGTEFGIIIDENEGFVKGSLRSRASFDVSKLAAELGGGGHKQAAGFILRMPLDEAVKLVLETARKAIKNY